MAHPRRVIGGGGVTSRGKYGARPLSLARARHHRCVCAVNKALPWLSAGLLRLGA